MKKIYAFITLLFIYAISHGQNLVPNGDFEIYGIVPCDWSATSSEFNSATSSWNTPTNATPDIQSTLLPPYCASHQPNSLYNCNNGSQVPLSGNIFAGFYTYAEVANYREYLQAHLTSPLVPGVSYIVELNVSLADNSMYATNTLGVGFSTSPTYVSFVGHLGYTPQVQFATAVTDTTNWTLLKDTIIPTQPYQYIIIGNFLHDSLTTLTTVDAGACVERAYYYIDNVSVYADTSLSIYEATNSPTVTLYPIPANDKLNVKINSTLVSEIILYDLTSRKLLEQKFTGTTSINTKQLAKGVYVYELRNEKGLIKKGKVLKD